MQYIELFKAAAENKSFLKVLFTHRHLQVGISNLKMGEDTGEEAWNADVLVLIVWGEGHIAIGEEERSIAVGDFIYIPPNTKYTIMNLGTEDLKLLLVFSSAVLRDGTDESSKVSEIMDPYKARPPDGGL